MIVQPVVEPMDRFAALLLLLSITIFIVTGDRVDVELAEMSAGSDGGKQLGGLLTIAQVQ